MYKISYEKCVCFIFIVILAVLSCSGFRIDNLAMTDISKRNSHRTDAGSAAAAAEARFFLDSTQSAPTTYYHHRLRHQRHLRAQAHTLRHTPPAHIDDITFPPSAPSPAIVTRPQRSFQHHPNRRNPKRRPGDDVTKKTYEAPIVVHAKAETGQIKGNIYTFRLIETIKNNSTMPVDDTFVITFHKTSEKNERKKHRKQIKTSKEYILFLKYNGAHYYTVFSDPELLRKNFKAKTLKDVRKIANPNFRPKPIEVTLERKIPLKEVQSTQLICKTRGLPIPNITWRRNGIELHRSQESIQIIYNKKRKSTLIVKNSTTHSNDKFECIANGVNGEEERAFFSMPASASSYDEKDCTSTGYCLNGNCTYIPSMREPYCLCFDGYFGDKCQNFKPPGSMYTPPSQFACKLGLQTKFNC